MTILHFERFEAEVGPSTAQMFIKIKMNSNLAKGGVWTYLCPECLVDDEDLGAEILQVSGRCGATLLWHDVSKPYLM